MKDVRVDDEGNMRCWKCGGKALNSERTTRSKLTLGVATLGVTKSKLRCQLCGEYNDTGSAKAWTSPKKPRLARKLGISDPGEQPVAASVTLPVAAWHPDPYGRFDHRWWDGATWTAEVSRDGVALIDPEGHTQKSELSPSAIRERLGLGD